MTNKEAITILNMVEAHGSLVIQAKAMAIQALSREPCENCCNGNQIEKAKLCQKSYLAGMEHKQEPCDDAIDRAEAMTEIMMSKGAYLYMGHPTIRISDAVQAIRELPSVTEKSNKYRKEAKRWKNKWLKSQKSGHWIAQDIHNCHTDFRCSECGYIHSFMHLYGKPTADYTYCPNCGADMRGDAE